MNNKKIGQFIKELLKSKGMNQDDLAKVLNITPQAVSKGLNGANIFDIGNLKTISDLFKVTIDDILNGELQTSTSTMSEQERLVRLGINAVKSADVTVINSADSKNMTVLQYAIIQSNHEILEYILEHKYLQKWYSQILSDDNFLKLIIDNGLQKHLLNMGSYNSMTKVNNFSRTSKELWACSDENLIELLYSMKNSIRDWNPNILEISNFDLAIRFNNKVVINKWFKSLEQSDKVISGNLEFVETAVKYFNHYFVEKFLLYLKESKNLRRASFTVDAYNLYSGDPKLLDYILNAFTDVGITVNYKNFSNLLEEFYEKKDYSNLVKYSKYGSVSTNKIDNFDFNKEDLKDILYFFKAGGLPTVQYNNEKSVNQYVDNVNKIILRLTEEILKKENKI